ncbi:mid1-interacting protein 1-B-like [Hyla sarda]|uniref:mid1-interacting protein 1-B-like n=1 Tax=Hyla sarda TaxID=327740 RepID=UPI0024C2B161|nr:mid1-interacting protein 1-B-like [Hyla sarda]XP_056410357.1 mid1-interacting protein 1-B-like [Hyla sarda]XP_056410358.1 mid1-interacting protein 1-B-like [Hyla sarda]XP_056410359.1 mid1-interacting protein 1-B-like [Hyla sarda]XP_056410360.1 mid1-interacting protein 1-B-like [Hyla sarda]XP_056410361.1 mid1-interacting protein 1-B-like [Hyla sarda]XP_056410362.1 mid1-interacting protein 1-B-like [Hyla sarda]XP_056410363.1 mid1-interacting protein 1-B-like [Hyla sarda]XP_056410364.1 mid1
MEVSECSPQRHSLLDAIHRFNTATTIMDETIMVPSMLQDITPTKEQEMPTKSTDLLGQDNNLYDSYLLLKSLRNDMKWGVHRENGVTGGQSPDREAPEEETSDLVDQFQHHLRGLLSVLTKLTKKANLLTNCYKKEVEAGTAGPFSTNHYY